MNENTGRSPALGAYIVRGRRAYVRAIVPAGHPACADGEAYVEYADGERDAVPLYVLQNEEIDDAPLVTIRRRPDDAA